MTRPALFGGFCLSVFISGALAHSGNTPMAISFGVIAAACWFAGMLDYLNQGIK